MKFAVSIIGITALMSGSALAADLSVEQPYAIEAAPEAALFDWTGFYAGVHGGLLQADDSMHGSFAGFYDFGNKSYDPSGGFFGLHAGYLYQFDNNLVVGVEGDWNWTNADGDLTADNTFNGLTASGTSSLNTTASVRARLGYAMDRTLFYVTGGVAFADYDYSFSLPIGMPNNYDGSFSATGYTVGVGVSQAFTNRIIGHIEYRYSDYGSHDFETEILSQPVSGTIDLATHALQAGISLKF